MFLLNPQSKLPLYEQLVEQLRRQIVLGNAAPGSPLPSVRQLSVELGVNPNTIQTCQSGKGTPAVPGDWNLLYVRSGTDQQGV